jgi:hypothetical protein
MASLTHESKNRHGWRLQCYDVHDSRRRHSIWLGEMQPKDAEKIKRHIEAILESQKMDTPMPGETVRWLATISDTLRKKLSPLLGSARTVAEAIDAYVEWAESNNKASTVSSSRHTLDAFRNAFSRHQMRSLSSDAVDQWIAATNVSGNTTAKHAKNLKSFIAWARQRGWVDDLKLHSSSTINAGSKEFIGVERFDELLAEFTDPQDRCVLALARWSGIRVPSELTIVRSGVDWERMRLTIPDSKRSRRSSRGPPKLRVTPIFPELSPFLEAVWQLDINAGPEEYLLPAIVGSGAIVARVRRARDRTGMQWPRLFHSLRATRQTELIARFGVRAACEWIGNSPSVASKFYELITDDTWKEATGK